MLKVILYIFLSAILYVVYRFIIKPYRIYLYYRKQGFPGQFYPFIGLAKPAMESFKKYGDVLGNYRELPHDNPKAKIFVSNFGDRCALQLLDSTLIKEFYANQDHLQKTRPSPGMSKLFRRGMLRLEGDEWKKRRKAISTMFHFNFINSNLPLIVQTTREFFGQLKTTDMKEVKIMEEVQKITGEIVGRIFFGNNLNKYQIDGQLLTLHLADLIAEVGAKGSTLPVILLGFLGLSPQIIPSYQKSIDKVQRFRDFCFKIVEDRKKSRNRGGTDLLELLLEFQEKNKDGEVSLSDEDIIDEFITFFSAGMDTTGHMLTMAIYLLAKNPHYLPKLLGEVKAVNINEATISNEDVNKLEFHHCVLKEALRLYSPGPGTFPRLVKEDYMLGEYKMLKGISVRPNFIFNFSHPEYFDDPEKFKPERWTDGKNLDPFVFIPFSAGQRNCIGQHLAILEGKIILAEFLRMYKFSIPENYNLRMTSRFLYEPYDKLLVDLVPN